MPARVCHSPVSSHRSLSRARLHARARRQLRALVRPRFSGDWRRWSAIALTVVGALCAVYLCFRASSELKTVPWLPRFVGEWADENGRLRNFPAFFLLTCPALAACVTATARGRVALAVGAFGALLELGERFVPGRWVEWQDIAWSWAGVALAWLLFAAGPVLAARLSFPRPLHRPAKPQTLP